MRQRVVPALIALAACLVVSPALANAFTIYLPLASLAPGPRPLLTDTPTSTPTMTFTPTSTPNNTPTSTSTPIFGSHPLLNGDFEQGLDVGWSRSQYASNILYSPGGAHTGEWEGYLASVREFTGQISQTVDVPREASTLVFWAAHASIYTDFGFENLNCSTGYVSITPGPDTIDIPTCIGTTRGWTQYSINLQAYAGRTVTLTFGINLLFIGRFNKAYAATWAVDDVAFVATAPTPTVTPTLTLTSTAPPTSTLTPTSISTATPTTMPTPTLTATPTATPTNTPTSP